MRKPTAKWVIIPSCIASFIALVFLLLWFLLPKYAPVWTANNSPFIDPVIRSLLTLEALEGERNSPNALDFCLFILENKFSAEQVLDGALPYIYSNSTTDKHNLLCALDRSFNDKRFLKAYRHLLFSDSTSDVYSAVFILDHEWLPPNAWALGQKSLLERNEEWKDQKDLIITSIIGRIYLATSDDTKFCHLTIGELYKFRHNMTNDFLSEIYMEFNTKESRAALMKLRNEILSGSLKYYDKGDAEFIENFLNDNSPD